MANIIAVVVVMALYVVFPWIIGRYWQPDIKLTPKAKMIGWITNILAVLAGAVMLFTAPDQQAQNQFAKIGFVFGVSINFYLAGLLAVIVKNYALLRAEYKKSPQIDSDTSNQKYVDEINGLLSFDCVALVVWMLLAYFAGGHETGFGIWMVGTIVTLFLSSFDDSDLVAARKSITDIVTKKEAKENSAA